MSPIPAIAAAGKEGVPGAPCLPGLSQGQRRGTAPLLPALRGQRHPGCPRPLRRASWRFARVGLVEAEGAGGADLLPCGAAVLKPAVRCPWRAGEYHCLPGFQFKMA